jgi:hypothetical protein
MPDPKIKQLALKNITADPSLQMRAKGLDEKLVGEYAEAMENGAEFPPAVVYHDNTGTNWLSQGFHRHAAALKAKQTTITVEMRSGNRNDAILDAASGNATHGLRRTNADKRRSASQVLTAFPDMPNSQIADIVGVSDTFVGDVKKTLQRISLGLSVKPPGSAVEKPTPPPTETESETERGGNVSTPEEDYEPPVVTVEHAGAPRATAVVNGVVKRLHKIQDELSGLLCGHFSQAMRDLGRGYTGCDLYDTGEIVAAGWHGGIQHGIAKWSCPTIDELLGYCGGLKLMLARVEHEPTAEQQYQDEMQGARELRDMAAENNAERASDRITF